MELLTHLQQLQQIAQVLQAHLQHLVRLHLLENQVTQQVFQRLLEILKQWSHFLHLQAMAEQQFKVIQ
jgi:hypothetical protein